MFQSDIIFNRVSCEKNWIRELYLLPFFSSLELIISVGRDQGSFLKIQVDINSMVPWAKILQKKKVEFH